MYKYSLLIDIQGQNLKLLVTDKKKIVGEIILPIERNLDSQLINGLDKLFKRNRLSKLHLESVEIAGEIDRNSTYYRIILAFKKGLLSTK